MRAQGVTLLDDLIAHSSVGLVESILPAFRVSLTLKKAKRYLKKHSVDLVILIDNQGMNLPLSRITKSLNIKTFYYFPPQVSIWGKWNATKLSRLVDMIFCPFREDHEIYRNAGGHSVYVGHPFLELFQKDKSSSIAVKSNNQPEIHTIGLFPGSRRQEILRLFPLFLDVAQLLAKSHPSRFLIPVSSGIFLSLLQRLLLPHGNLNLDFIGQGDYKSYATCDLSIISSGTASLELALLSVPQIVVYRLNPITYFLTDLFLRIPYISLPNILLRDHLVPEYIQGEATVGNILRSAISLLTSPQQRSRHIEGLRGLASHLGPGDTLKTMARHIHQNLLS